MITPQQAFDSLSEGQKSLYYGVLAVASVTGLHWLNALAENGDTDADRAAVADAIGGPGVGDQFRRMAS